MWGVRSHGADSGQVLADGVGVSAYDHCHAHSLCGGWQGQQLSVYMYILLSKLSRHFYTTNEHHYLNGRVHTLSIYTWFTLEYGLHTLKIYVDLQHPLVLRVFISH